MIEKLVNTELLAQLSENIKALIIEYKSKNNPDLSCDLTSKKAKVIKKKSERQSFSKHLNGKYYYFFSFNGQEHLIASDPCQIIEISGYLNKDEGSLSRINVLYIKLLREIIVSH